MADGLVDTAPRALGPGGPEVGPLGFGAWRFTHDDPGRGAEVLEAAVDAGLTLVDTAEVYGLDWGGRGLGSVEEALGRALALRPGLRDRVVLATKGGILPPTPYDSSDLRTAVEGSLRRLGVDHVELYLVHRPDLFTHPEVVADALAGAVADGLVGTVGVSNHTPPQTEALAHHLAARGVPLVATQPELSVVALDPARDGTLDLAARTGMAVLAWSPLAGGRIATGEGLDPALGTLLDELAAREGVDRPSVAVAFALCLPTRPVALLGSQRPERLAALAAAVPTVHLDREDCYRLVVASGGVPLP
ncbi:aldo/keto reductase [Iamia majanohamensis]|uniref:Aldo/keto reductase n=1 Tax=Iamia majanohamensis TaxID=467976 RepID=A0AAF0BSU1_9ACTN|nr:aldo/keto reductase [Iamia majanohamensis]WCO65812.1 aldo/keto reductase [Iamia majanohamensis]